MGANVGKADKSSEPSNTDDELTVVENLDKRTAEVRDYLGSDLKT